MDRSILRAIKCGTAFVLVVFSLLTDSISAAAVASGKEAVNAQASSQSLNQGWKFRIAAQDIKSSSKPDSSFHHWRSAGVPGHVHTDLLAHGLIPDPYTEMHEAQLQWIGKAQWEYRMQFDLDPALHQRQRQDLVFDGLDTFADVYLNGEKIFSADNAFRSWRIPVQNKLRERGNELRVIFHSPIDRVLPEVQAMPNKLAGNYPSPYGDEPKDALTANFVRKPGYHYGWDWGPRYVTAGIWQSVRLEAFDRLRIDHLAIAQNNVSREHADLLVDVSIENASLRVVSAGYMSRSSRSSHSLELIADVFDTAGKLVITERRPLDLQNGLQSYQLPIKLKRPQLWFPNGMGKQDLYTVKLRIVDGLKTLAQAQKRIGLRTVELRREHDQWGQSFTFVINGVPVFAKGANSIPFDMFANRISAKKQRDILQAARDANMNMLRVWGGGYYESDAFYDAADELGLMIWQDFMFGGGVVPAYQEDFRKNVIIEARQQVLRLRHHPSIVLWCGNNEEETAWKDWGIGKSLSKDNPVFAEQVWQGYVQLFGHDLRKLVAELGMNIPYWSSSPSNDLSEKANDSERGDKHYWEVWAGSQAVENYLRETPRFMSEFGLQAWPDIKTINSFSKTAEQAIESPVIRQHQKFLAGEGNQRILHYIRANYGEPRSFPDFVYLSQIMQAEGISLAIGHHRASQPRTMGSLYWQLNDVWPGASWSGIDYFGRWKALHFQVARAFAPQALVAERDAGLTKVSLISDALSDQQAQQKTMAQLRMRVMDFSGKVLKQKAWSVTAPVNTSLTVATLSDTDLIETLDPKRHVAIFEWWQVEKRVARTELYFAPAKDLQLPAAAIVSAWRKRDQYYELTLKSAVLCRALWIDFAGMDVKLSDNAITLLPGETRVIRVEGKGSQLTLARLKSNLGLKYLERQ
jgi:beta-mannosidase